MLHIEFFFILNDPNYDPMIQCCYPVGIYLLKVNNRNTRTRCEICSKLTVKTPERHQCRRSDVFIVNFEHILHLVLVLLFNYEHVNADRVKDITSRESRVPMKENIRFTIDRQLRICEGVVYCMLFRLIR